MSLDLPSKPKLNIEDKPWGKQVVSYFFQGLLLVAPFVVTVYVVVRLFIFLDSQIPIKIPGVGLLIIFILIVGAGYFSNNFLFRPFFIYLERILTQLPLAKIIYTSLQDLFSAFVSEKRKFDQPVLVIFNKTIGLKKMGFLTREDLSDLGRKGEVAVYLPHSYNFSGNLYVIPKEHVIVLEDISAAEAMKFIVSGGVTNIKEARTTKAEPTLNIRKAEWEHEE